MIMNYKRKDEERVIETYLTNYGEILKEKKENMAKLIQENEMQKCTFRPNINKYAIKF